MFRKSAVAAGIALVFAANVYAGEKTGVVEKVRMFDISGYLEHEVGVLTQSGLFTSQKTGTPSQDLEDKNDSGDIYKSETTARIKINGSFSDRAKLHADLQLIHDDKAVSNKYQNHEEYTQSDILRALHVDTQLGDPEYPTNVRVGKQVLQGSTDGINGIINPIDLREMMQNISDSRIGVWMVNTNKKLKNGGELQFIASQAEENKIPGMGGDLDADHPFVMKGVRTMQLFQDMLGADYVVERPSDSNLNLAARYNNQTPSGTKYSLAYLYAYDPNSYVEISKKNGSEYKFTEKTNRVHNLGGMVSKVVNKDSLPIMLKGEFLYQKDVTTTIIDQSKCKNGGGVASKIAGSKCTGTGAGDELDKMLTNQKGDAFKYVLGANTQIGNKMMGLQFIQMRNMDFVDELTRHTADRAVMTMDNGLKKALENRELYSFFIGGPFGQGMKHKWTNILIYEEGDGYWNRLSLDYNLQKDLMGTLQWNQYWGDENTQFGQFKDSSNVQAGLKKNF